MERLATDTKKMCPVKPKCPRPFFSLSLGPCVDGADFLFLFVFYCTVECSENLNWVSTHFTF